MPTTKCSAALAQAFAEKLQRGASFKYTARAVGVPIDTARYWWKRGQLELSRLAEEGGDAEPSVFAQFAQIIDAAMGEAVLSASERLWRDNPSAWLRWSYARQDFYPVEAKAAARNEAQEAAADERATRHSDIYIPSQAEQLEELRRLEEEEAEERKAEQPPAPAQKGSGLSPLAELERFARELQMPGED